ncbi:lysozyme inhibitor LprI family protein [Erwinia billingiae]|uniref:lysozyme inhibitor LprI family protein n=1 Tax=Erwinia billingiae TaxID=182337 RepID=UPI003207B907
MFKKSLLLSSFLFCSLSAHAGFFGGNDFKCGRDDAVKALPDSIRTGAAGMLQSDYMTNSSDFYSKNILDFQGKLNTIGINVSNVSTSGGKGNDLRCIATVGIKLPAETLDVLKEFPKYLSSFVANGGAINSDSIVWSNLTYNIKLADNKKDIAVTNVEYITRSLKQAAILAVTKDEVINKNFNYKVSDAKHDYTTQDAYLNTVWKNLPDSARASMKKQQVAWVNEKAVKCGKLSDANSIETPAQKRIEIYKCQTEMTLNRIAFLGGDRED